MKTVLAGLLGLPLLAGCMLPPTRAEMIRNLHDSCIATAVEGSTPPDGCGKYAAEMERAKADAARDQAEADAAAAERERRRKADPVGFCIEEASFDYEVCSHRAKADAAGTYTRTVYQQQVVETRLQTDLQQCAARQTADLARCQNLPRPAVEAPPPDGGE